MARKRIPSVIKTISIAIHFRGILQSTTQSDLRGYSQFSCVGGDYYPEKPWSLVQANLSHVELLKFNTFASHGFLCDYIAEHGLLFATYSHAVLIGQQFPEICQNKTIHFPYLEGYDAQRGFTKSASLMIDQEHPMSIKFAHAYIEKPLDGIEYLQYLAVVKP